MAPNPGRGSWQQPVAPKKPAPSRDFGGSFGGSPSPSQASKQLPPPPPTSSGHSASIIDATPGGMFDSPGADSSGKALPSPASSLIGPLKLPAGLDATSQFVWDYSTAPDAEIQRPGDVGRQTMTTMTVAGALSWFRSLAVNSPDHYNEVVHQLVAAGYATPQEARYGSYSVSMGDKFLQSVADVWAVNQEQGPGATVRWMDHIQSMIKGRQDSGQVDANGLPLTSGSGAPQGPVRQDNWSDPETVKASINNAAKNVLGRELTDKEVSAFAGAFHAQEQSYNDKVWAGQQAAANGGTATMPDRPSAAAAAQNYEQSNPAQTQERTTQMLGSYMGVLRNITGLGSGGVAGAVR